MSDNLVFFDTNIFIYTFDRAAVEKSKCAKELIEQALNTNSAVISTQVVQEFLNVALRKLAVPMSPAEAKLYLDMVLMPICRVFPGQAFYERALELHSTTRYSFYDSLIIAAALQAECSILYTEDLQHNHQVSGLSIVNPFVR